MKKYETYDPPGFSLPTLKIKKRTSRKNIENDITVNNLIESRLLLDSEFNSLYLNILNKSNKIYNLFKNPIRHGKESFFEILSSIDIKDDKMVNIFLDTLKDWAAIGNKTAHFNNKSAEDIIFRFNKNINIENKAKLIDLSKKIQNDLNNFEESRKVDLSILSITTVYFCRNCNQVDYILRKKNLHTLVGYDVLGNSGVWHEIDNIAYCKNENYRFFCECKTSEVNEKDVFIFSGKMIDIGGTRGYIFTTSNNISDKISRLARSKNIDVIKRILIKDLKNLISDIKEN